MGTLKKELSSLFAAMGDAAPDVRKQRRIAEVYERYKGAMESVYGADARLFLDHTNAVYILRDDPPKPQKRLVVYVDDSIYAAELNAQRELLRLKLLELYGEHIDVFDIFISRGGYRKKHPFDRMRAETVSEPVRKTPPMPLSDEEKMRVGEACAHIENPHVQRALEKAMKADLEWKKGEKGKK